MSRQDNPYNYKNVRRKCTATHWNLYQMFNKEGIKGWEYVDDLARRKDYYYFLFRKKKKRDVTN